MLLSALRTIREFFQFCLGLLTNLMQVKCLLCVERNAMKMSYFSKLKVAAQCSNFTKITSFVRFRTLSSFVCFLSCTIGNLKRAIRDGHSHDGTDSTNSLRKYIFLYILKCTFCARGIIPSQSLTMQSTKADESIEKFILTSYNKQSDMRRLFLTYRLLLALSQRTQHEERVFLLRSR